MKRPLRIAIDGPSGSGKSTLGRELARRLGLPYIDTGAMYRAVAWAAGHAGVDDAHDIVAHLIRLRLEITADPDDFRVQVNGRDVTDLLRTPEVGRAAAEVAAIAAVRAWLVPQQQAAAAGGAVVEGRDIGTAVLPDADFKFFVTSDEGTRMARRAAQLGTTSDAVEVVGDVRERDRMDRSRRISPLVPAPDAICLDTSGQTVEQSLAAMLREIDP